MNQQQIFQSLIQEGHPLFLTFAEAAPIIGAQSEAALRQAFRRRKCPVRVTFSFTGTLGFSLPDITEYLATGKRQEQPILVRSVTPVQAKAKRGAPTKVQRIANKTRKGDQHD